MRCSPTVSIQRFLPSLAAETDWTEEGETECVMAACSIVADAYGKVIDITDRASEEEFESAHKFMSGLMSRFGLTPTRCIIVPGNHDLSWEVEGYTWLSKRKVDPKQLSPGTYVEQGVLYGVRDEAIYPKRFENFGKFFHQLTQQPYSLKPEDQCLPFLLEEHCLQFVAINSAWEIDEYFPDRSSINQSALASGLLKATGQIENAKKEGRLEKNRSVLRIAVWHHPVTGNDKIVSDAFLEQLRQDNVKLCLHGHVHEDIDLNTAS
jgi:hypothetical protein